MSQFVEHATERKKHQKPSYDVTDYGAKFDGGGHLANLDLPPRLNMMHCRDCGKPVPSDRATCPHCTKQGGGS